MDAGGRRWGGEKRFYHRGTEDTEIRRGFGGVSVSSFFREGEWWRVCVVGVVIGECGQREYWGGDREGKLGVGVLGILVGEVGEVLFWRGLGLRLEG